MLKNPSKMKFRYLILFLFTAMITKAQVSGYMGKRFSIGYSNYFFIAGIGPTANASAPSGEVGINTTHCVNLEYTTRSRTNFCLSLQKLTTGMTPRVITKETYDGVSGYNTVTYEYEPKPYTSMQISSFNVGLGFKFFQSGTLAPIGKYKKLELLILLNHLEYKKNGFTYYDYNSPYGLKSAAIGTGDYQFNTFAISYTLGRSRVFLNRVVLDYGIRFGVVPAGLWAVLNEDGDFFSESSYNTFIAEQHFKYDTNTRLFRYQMVNFHLGLSFLTF